MCVRIRPWGTSRVGQGCGEAGRRMVRHACSWPAPRFGWSHHQWPACPASADQTPPSWPGQPAGGRPPEAVGRKRRGGEQGTTEFVWTAMAVVTDWVIMFSLHVQGVVDCMAGCGHGCPWLGQGSLASPWSHHRTPRSSQLPWCDALQSSPSHSHKLPHLPLSPGLKSQAPNPKT